MKATAAPKSPGGGRAKLGRNDGAQELGAHIDGLKTRRTERVEDRKSEGLLE